MCLKSNKFYKQTSASALRASLLPKRPHQWECNDLGDSPGSFLPFVCSHSLTDTTKHHSHSFKRSCGFISAPQTHPAFCIAPDTPWYSPSLSALRHRQGAEMPYPPRGVSLHPATSYIGLSHHLFFSRRHFRSQWRRVTLFQVWPWISSNI